MTGLRKFGIFRLFSLFFSFRKQSKYSILHLVRKIISFKNWWKPTISYTVKKLPFFRNPLFQKKKKLFYCVTNGETLALGNGTSFYKQEGIFREIKVRVPQKLDVIEKMFRVFDVLEICSPFLATVAVLWSCNQVVLLFWSENLDVLVFWSQDIHVIVLCLNSLVFIFFSP